ncbi:MAG: biotin/lipoyl-binding protein [Prevotella sp.]|jgi:HlyD family secretion protein|nr:biotin/lipoyl-binding protein [Prevotella sp.]MBO6098915.1 biotin/lipoyl-binding protein [Prevotella sp.]MBO6234865.1 biotin/lipoyl-binding protein [Prevotella sp.]MBP3750464.1 biotin/lipoyl-binding protein [Prevotella sp.]MBQ1650668.1 biotin/lipoyl-binding protein [Prevotella sp.]
MENKKQHRSVIIALIAFSVVAFIVGLIGFFTIGSEEEVIQGQIDVEEYRVSSKVPSRVLRLLVKEGDYVHAGDTLAILDAPEVEAKAQQVRGMEDAATAMSDMARAGARKEQIQGAFELWQQAKAGLDIAKKSYERVQRLFDEGVVSEQKRDEAYASYKAYEAQEKAAKSQYDMAQNGARREEKAAAQAQVNSAKGAVNEVNSYRKETVQVAQMDGEVSTIYPKVGELLGSGSPIMTISIMNDIWGTFNMREDQLNGLKLGDVLKAFVPAFNKEIELKVYSIKDEGSYATWKATKSNGQYDMKTFEVKARPVKKFDGLRPGMSVIIK